MRTIQYKGIWLSLFDMEYKFNYPLYFLENKPNLFDSVGQRIRYRIMNADKKVSDPIIKIENSTLNKSVVIPVNKAPKT